MNLQLLARNPLTYKKPNDKQTVTGYKLLKLLHVHGPLPVTALTQSLDISTPVLSGILSRLVKEKWIEKKGKGDSIGGRRPDLYALRDHSFFTICIDVELFATRLAIVDNNFNIVTAIENVALHLGNSRKDFCANIRKAVKSLLASVKIAKDRIIGCSIGMPGLTSQSLGENYTYLLDQADHPLQYDLEQDLKLPVVLQNDVKGAALAELRHGLARGRQNVLVLLMDWGVGLGIIMDGQVRQGSWGFSGEIGHIPFVENGELCYCGKRGCLETVASGLALSKIARKDISTGTSSILGNLSKKDIQELAPSHIIDAANKGDQYAIQLLSDIGANIGKGTSTLIQLFNPELIILSGKIAEAKQYITLPMQQAINTYCMTQVREKTKIISSNHPEHFRFFGYATNAIETFLDASIKAAGS